MSMDRGEVNVLARLRYLYREAYGQEPNTDTEWKMLEDYRLARRQGVATYLSDEVADTIIRWAKP